MDRRTTIKWVLAAAATMHTFALRAADATARDVSASQAGYGTDPDVMKEYPPGELWPLTLTEGAQRTTRALCDLIIPADDVSPSASAAGVVDFLDEWISAPYPQQRADREIVLVGLLWIEAESIKRFARGFAELDEIQQRAIADDICYAPRAAPPFAEAARFFARLRDLTASGFYSTPVGWKDIGYVGNVPLETFDGPPPQVLKKAGLA